jgi:hypothetical protein
VVAETIRCLKGRCYPRYGCDDESKNEERSAEKLRLCYRKAGPEYRRKVIDQAVELMGYHRKSAIRALAAKPAMALGLPGIIGRPRTYEPRC